MAASIFRSSAVSNAIYGTPDISGLICTSFSISQTADVQEVKDDQGSVVAVAVGEPIKEISFEGMRTGSFSLTVGGLASITMPAGASLGSTTICTSLETSFAAEQFENISGTLRSYQTAMSLAAA
jgi:hypothetical protein